MSSESSFATTKFLTPMKRKGEPLSFKSLDAQIRAMLVANCLVEDKNTRIQFMKRIEAVQRDLYGLRSELESSVPGNVSSTKTQNVRDITQRIDDLSEGLALVTQRHRHRLQVPGSNQDQYQHSDYHRDSDPYAKAKTTYSKDTDRLKSNNSYSFEYSQTTRNSEGHQVQISISHARRYYHSSSNGQAHGYNQFTPGPNYINNPQSINLTRFSPSLSSHLEGNHSHGYSSFTGYPGALYVPPSPKGRERDSLNYSSGGRHSQHSGSSSTGYPSSQRYGYPRNSPRSTGAGSAHYNLK